MRSFLALFLFISLNAWGAELQLPTLSSPVMDLAQVMSESDREDLSTLAYEIYTNKGPQITILTVPDMQGHAIEEFSIRVAEKWKLGGEKEDNGLLVIVAQAERQMRIEVGQGLEGDITDYETAQYTRRIFPEYFRRGDFHGGLRVFMEDVAKKFNIQVTETAHRRYVRPVRTELDPKRKLGLMGFFAVLLIGAMITNKIGRGIFTGIGFAGSALFMGGAILQLLFVFIFGFVIGTVGVINFLSFIAYASRRGGGGYGGGGFGGGSGGGWSGGGGGFSGGGSSGSW